MAEVESVNPAVPAPLRLVTWVECLVVLTAGALLFFFPALGREVWAWKAPPFNSRFVGAVYFAALYPLAVFALSGRWSPGRIVLWMIFTFTLAVLIAMVLHLDRFEWQRPGTWVFWFLYLFLPPNSLIFLFLLRRLPLAGGKPVAGFPGVLCRVSAAVLAAYGLALLLAPSAAAAFWPWPVDSFHAQVYSATFLAPAIGALRISRKAAPSEFRTLGVTLAILAVFGIAGVLWTTASVPPPKKIVFGRPGTIAFFAMNLAVGAAGAGFVAAARRIAREA